MVGKAVGRAAAEGVTPSAAHLAGVADQAGEAGQRVGGATMQGRV